MQYGGRPGRLLPVSDTDAVCGGHAEAILPTLPALPALLAGFWGERDALRDLNPGASASGALPTCPPACLPACVLYVRPRFWGSPKPALPFCCLLH